MMSQLRCSSLGFTSKSLRPSFFHNKNNITNLPVSLNLNRDKDLSVALNGFQRDFKLWAFASTTGPVIDSGAGDGGNNNNRGNGGGGEGGSSDWGNDSEDNENENENTNNLGFVGAFLKGWKSRVEADPQFPFKVLMEELVGVSACVIGDMASRPNFGLNELDFVFSTLVVGSILNFTLMYLLAPSSSSATSSSLPGLFATCPPSHMFEPGVYNGLERLGTFVYKGAIFATVGFAAGLVGTALSNALIGIRMKMDPNFETPNKPPPTLLNASTWALHMGLNSNFRYQTLNGIEFLLAKGLSPLLFKSSVIVLRCLNNVVGGMSFVVLARLTGSQRADGPPPPLEKEEEQEQKLLDEAEGLQPNQSS